MNVTCHRSEDLLLRGDDESLRQLERHAGSCRDCADQLESWESISSAATALKARWADDGLWNRIREGLAEAPQGNSFEVRYDVPPFDESADREFLMFERGRRLAASADVVPFSRWLRSGAARFAVAATLVLIVGAGSAMYLTRQLGSPSPDFDRWVLQESALQEVVRAEQEHMASIDRLSSLVEPVLEDADTPLMMSYREKLILLDDAIEECRAQVVGNRQNTHLRRQLLAMYSEKDRTLREVMKESTNVQE